MLMNYIRIIPVLLIFITSCNEVTETASSDRTPDKKIRKEAIGLAKRYVSSQLKEPGETVANGIISISDSIKRFIINPSKIYVGLVDEDLKKDAIVTVVSFRDQELDRIEHLFILRTGKKFMLIKVFESDMRILELTDRIITAEIPTRPRTSPLYNCASCQAIVKYKYKDGDVVKVE